MKTSAVIRNWQLMSLGLLVSNLILLTLFYIGKVESQIVPYLVEVDKLGQPRALGPIEPEISVDERTQRWQIMFAIGGIRSRSPDKITQQEQNTAALEYFSGNALKYIKSAWDNNNPFTGKTTTVIEISSVLKLDEDHWQVDWRERSYKKIGFGETEEPWRAIIATRITPPTSVDELAINPTGLQITELSWNRLNTEESK